jgi:hypothetical protein
MPWPAGKPSPKLPDACITLKHPKLIQMAKITIILCDIVIAINLPQKSLLYKNILVRYKNFIILPKKKENIFLNIKIANSYHNQTPRIDTLGKEVGIKGPGLKCVFQRKSNILSGKAEINDNIYSFDTLLRLILSQALLEKKGFLVHACGLSIGNKGMLLPGKSGRGKTTLSRKMPNNKIFSDELVCLRHYEKKPYLISTPFWGEFGTPGINFRQKLNGIYFLNKKSRNKISSMSKDEALKALLKLILFFSDNPTDIQILLKLSSECIMNTSCYRIYLTKKIDYAGLKKLICSK